MPTYPITPKSDVAEVLHGETIPDPYRWLEDGDHPDTRRWTDAQNALTRTYLDAVPGRDELHRRLDQLLAIGAIGVPTPVRGRYFYQRRDGRQNQPVLYVRVGLHGEDRAVIDPNALDPGGTVALDWHYPSDDGRLLAYGISENGSEQSVLHVMDVDTGEILPLTASPTRAPPTWRGCRTARASTTPVIPRRVRYPRVRSPITARSASIASAPIRPLIR